MFTSKTYQPDSPWTTEPLTAYKEFLQSTGQIADPNYDTEQKVHVVHAGYFRLLESMPSHTPSCSKLVIRNVKNAEFDFTFDIDCVPGYLSITPKGNTEENLKIAYRNIVPVEFKNDPQVAPASKAFHEHIIDSARKLYKDKACLSFTTNSNITKFPIKIIFENCQGNCAISGIDQDSFSKVFEIKGDNNKLEVSLNSQTSNSLRLWIGLEKNSYQSLLHSNAIICDGYTISASTEKTKVSKGFRITAIDIIEIEEN